MKVTKQVYKLVTLYKIFTIRKRIADNNLSVFIIVEVSYNIVLEKKEKLFIMAFLFWCEKLLEGLTEDKEKA